MARRRCRNAFALGALRTVRQSAKRFVALAVICMLGATMIVGLRAACADLRYSADEFFDAQQLFDVRVQSTLGLEQGDIDALSDIAGVERAEGGWTETVYTTVGAGSAKAEVRALSEQGMNEPLVLEGALPADADQVAVTRRYAQESGLGLGDALSFHSEADNGEDAGADAGEAGADAGSGADVAEAADVDDDADDDADVDIDIDDADEDASTPVFTRKEYTISAIVLDPQDVNAGEGSMSFRSSGDAQYAFFVVKDNVEAEVFTVAYLSVEGAKDPLCYSDAYENLVASVKQRVEDAREERQRARGESVRADANTSIDDAEAKADEKLAEGQQEIDDAAAELSDGRAELEDGKAQLASKRATAVKELGAAQAQIDDGLAQLASGAAELDAREQEVESGLSQVEDGISQLDEASAQLEAGIAQAQGQLDGLQAAEAAVSPGDEAAQDGAAQDEATQDGAAQDEAAEARQAEAAQAEAVAARQAAEAELSAKLSELQAQKDALGQQSSELERQRGELLAAREQIAQGRAEAEASRVQLEAAQAQLDKKRASAFAQIDEGRATLSASERELQDGADELADARATLESKRAEASGKIADARAKVADIEDATWYVQDRDDLPSYASIESDASCIEVLGTVLPIVFFVVAVLISLTTMTRMVEEERGLVGLYKALGYLRRRILSKYTGYAGAACLAGGVVGDLLGFVVLPAIIFTIFQTMYALPGFVYRFDAVSGLVAIALFAAGIVGATVTTCVKELREAPAALMRPKAPKAGSRILLERVAFVWRRMGFLNKVTARNIFRYKRRFLMTVFGIAGCVALLICGFGIRDTVLSLSDRQYGDDGVLRYDLMAVCASDDLDDVAGGLAADAGVESLLRLRIDSLTASYGAGSESVTLYVVPDGCDLSEYVRLRDDAGNPLSLGASGCAITKNAEQVLGFAVGDTLHVQDSTLKEADVCVQGVATNYLGNWIFMSASAYEAAFGETAADNGILAKLSGDDTAQIAFADTLAGDTRLLSLSSTAKLVRDFSSSFSLINTVVYVVIVLAALLSFTVVFTLSNTNISERERELATIKVLGFRRREVHVYINKETLILTGIGVLVGMPAGYALTRSLTYVLKMPSLYFDTVVAWPTYLYAAALAFAFTLAVNAITNRSLDRVDMVGALKSAE